MCTRIRVLAFVPSFVCLVYFFTLNKLKFISKQFMYCALFFIYFFLWWDLFFLFFLFLYSTHFLFFSQFNITFFYILFFFLRLHFPNQLFPIVGFCKMGKNKNPTRLLQTPHMWDKKTLCGLHRLDVEHVLPHMTLPNFDECLYNFPNCSMFLLLQFVSFHILFHMSFILRFSTIFFAASLL